jgi:hypothetical protein
MVDGRNGGRRKLQYEEYSSMSTVWVQYGYSMSIVWVQYEYSMGTV